MARKIIKRTMYVDGQGTAHCALYKARMANCRHDLRSVLAPMTGLLDADKDAVADFLVHRPAGLRQALEHLEHDREPDVTDMDEQEEPI